jgi:hypothetical protein
MAKITSSVVLHLQPATRRARDRYDMVVAGDILSEYRPDTEVAGVRLEVKFRRVK